MSIRSEATLLGLWQLDPERSSVEFRVRHFWGLMTVKGRFEDYEGRLDLSADPAIELTIDAASLQTGHRKRDAHLRSPDFFDVEKQPQVRFASESVVSQDDTLRVRGSLFARGQSIPLDLVTHIARGREELEIEAAASAPHRALGMTWNRLGMIQSRSELLVKGYLVPAG
jgi:polyisoprenoid-binding protein YceI